jgi:hypothetical protein
MGRRDSGEGNRMTEIRSHIRRIEQRVGKQPELGKVDWDALLAHVAKNGKRLVEMDREA